MAIQSENKPHLGNLRECQKYSVDGDKYVYWGWFEGHPDFNGKYGHTSEVIKQEGDEIETLNSRYSIVSYKKSLTND